MEYIYAALLLNDLGKEINEGSLNAVVKAAGKEPDEAMAKSVAGSLKGVNIKEVIEKAQAAQAAAPAAAAEQKKPEAKPEEEKKTEEEAAGGLAGLFG